MFFDNLFDQTRFGFDPWEDQRRQALIERRAEAERKRLAERRLRKEMLERERIRRAAQPCSASSSSGGEEDVQPSTRRHACPWGMPSESAFNAFTRQPARNRSSTEYRPKSQARPVRASHAAEAPVSQCPHRRVPTASERACPIPGHNEQSGRDISPNHAAEPSPTSTSSRSPRDTLPAGPQQQPATPSPNVECNESNPAVTAALAQIAKIVQSADAIKQQYASAFTPIESDAEGEQIRRDRGFLEEGLLQQVIKLDGVDSCGDLAVRQARRSAINSIETCVQELKAFAEQHDSDKSASLGRETQPEVDSGDTSMDDELTNTSSAETE